MAAKKTSKTKQRVATEKTPSKAAAKPKKKAAAAAAPKQQARKMMSASSSKTRSTARLLATVERPVAKGGQDGRPAAKTTTGPKVTAKAGVNAGATAPREGTKLPAFSLADHTGATVNRESLLGEPLVLYFYPKDDTPGCTKEACDFNAELKQFEGLGVRVVGVSPDSAARHVNFRNKYGLGFTLLSDPDAVLARALDVYQLKKNYGREYMGIVRSTFLIDRAGVIRKAWRAVRVAGHVPDVIDAAKSL